MQLFKRLISPASCTENWHQSSIRKTQKMPPLNIHILDRNLSRIILITKRILVQRRRKFGQYYVQYLHLMPTQKGRSATQSIWKPIFSHGLILKISHGTCSWSLLKRLKYYWNPRPELLWSEECSSNEILCHFAYMSFVRSTLFILCYNNAKRNLSSLYNLFLNERCF